MNVRQARQVLRSYQPSGDDDGGSEVKEALKAAAKTPELEAEFRNQVAFDRELSGLLDVELPGPLATELEDAARRLEGPRARGLSFREPAMLTVGFAFVVLIGLAVWVLLGRMNSFAGQQEAIDIVLESANGRVESFEEIETNAGSLADWFLVKSFDGFVVPPGLERAPVVGVRISKHDDVPVAVAAIAEPKALCLVFEASPFGISIPAGRWNVLRYGPDNASAMAITQVGAMAFVLAPKEGGETDLRKFLDGLPRSE